MYKIFTFFSGLSAFVSATAFFTALIFFNDDEIGMYMLKTSAFCFAMFFVFGMGSLFHEPDLG